ncbi:hypothetical protein ACHAO7_011818 [Fusarium culmorum]
MSAQISNSHFRIIQTFEIDYAPCKITQYVSDRSGMQVVVVNRNGPKLNGYFTLATETLNDSGVPHILEHLVSMGSKNYPYSGLLHQVSSRVYSSTDAWTAVDRTVYTLESASWDAFAEILPVYLDHILSPSITDEAIVTEVWHIDGEGKDAGVVYCEIQDKQSRGPNIVKREAHRLLYPDNVGFHYEVGGMADALRDVTPERIRQFHKDMYQPRNMCLVLVGEVEKDKLLQILEGFEESIKDDVPSLDSPFKRPWIDSFQPAKINEVKTATVEFPGEDESFGAVLVCFFGPDCISVIDSTAIDVLLYYLCGASVSMLHNVMVEKEHLASSVVYQKESRPDSVIQLWLQGVSSGNFVSVEKRLIEFLKEVASKAINIDYMREYIHRQKRQIKCDAENSVYFYATRIITDFVFGKRDGSTLADLQDLKQYDDLETWSDKQWRDFPSKWMVDVPHIAVIGKPSKELTSRMNENEKARIAKSREDLGPEGFDKHDRRLEKAKMKNEELIPAEVLDQWSVPDIHSIHLIESDPARCGNARSVGLNTGSAQKVIDNATQGKLPLFIQFEDVPTNFVYISIHISTSQIPIRLKPLMPIFCTHLFKTHIVRGGKQVSYEQVVRELERDTIKYNIIPANSFGDPNGIVIQFEVDPEKYEAAAKWVHTMMFDSIFDPQLLSTSDAKGLASIPALEGNGELMVEEISASLHLRKSSLDVAQSALVRAEYLKILEELLEKEPRTVVDQLNTVRDSLFTFGNLRILVTANLAC